MYILRRFCEPLMVCINYCTSSEVLRVLSERGAPRSLEGDTEIRKLQAVDSRQCMRKCTVLNNEHMSTQSHPINSFWALWMAPSERRILIPIDSREAFTWELGQTRGNVGDCHTLPPCQRTPWNLSTTTLTATFSAMNSESRRRNGTKA